MKYLHFNQPGPKNRPRLEKIINEFTVKLAEPVLTSIIALIIYTRYTSNKIKANTPLK
jgi:hypothetical protein